jgi:hypothetical protein
MIDNEDGIEERVAGKQMTGGDLIMGYILWCDFQHPDFLHQIEILATLMIVA